MKNSICTSRHQQAQRRRNGRLVFFHGRPLDGDDSHHEGCGTQDSRFSRAFLGVQPNITNIIGRWRSGVAEIHWPANPGIAARANRCRTARTTAAEPRRKQPDADSRRDRRRAVRLVAGKRLRCRNASLLKRSLSDSVVRGSTTVKVAWCRASVARTSSATTPQLLPDRESRRSDSPGRW